MGRSTGPSKTTVELVWGRDEGRCARCGIGLHLSDRGAGWSLHHRVPRGMGGSKSPWVNQPGNLIVLCGSGVTGCHGWIESNRKHALEAGWLVSRHGVLKPVQVPVVDLSGRAWWLDDAGGKEAA